MACLQIYKELLPLATFLRVHSIQTQKRNPASIDKMPLLT